VLDQLGRVHELTFDIDERAFKHEMLTDVETTPVVKNNAIKGGTYTLAERLKKILARIPVPSGATYVIRGDVIEITTGSFATRPELADNRLAILRDSAAGIAARAAAGEGEDAAKLDAKQRAGLRKQALDWLRADLALWNKQLESNTPKVRLAVRASLRRWQENPDLAGLRDAAKLAKLPAAERADCRQFWAEVKALLKKCEGDKP
jgi:hypothetical protein